MFVLTKSCPKKVIIQHTPTTNFDYSKCKSFSECWEDEKLCGGWLEDHIECYVQIECEKERDNSGRELTEEEKGILREKVEEEAKEGFFASLGEYSQEEILQDAEDGFAWPVEMGFVEEIEDK